MEQLSSRDALRGTGRTTKALKAAVEYAKSCAKPSKQPIAILVVSNKEQWPCIKGLVKDLSLTGMSEQQRRLDFGEVSVFVHTPDQAETAMRGYRCPIILDHSVMENLYWKDYRYEHDVRLMRAMYDDRIVTP